VKKKLKINWLQNCSLSWMLQLPARFPARIAGTHAATFDAIEETET
jgi:hypothetical protein